MANFLMMQKAFLLTMLFAIDIYASNSTSLFQENNLQFPDGNALYANHIFFHSFEI